MHIVFHGCLQSRTTDGIGDAFIERTGYLRYADANRIVLLFPQTNANTAPNACWDWWGYASSDHLSRGAAAGRGAGDARPAGGAAAERRRAVSSLPPETRGA